MINYKTQLENLKKEQIVIQKEINELYVFSRKLSKEEKLDVQIDMRILNIKLREAEAKISLLSQIIDDLKKEWQRLDRQICNSAFKEFEYERQGLMKFISQITGMSSEELKEVLK